MSGASFDAPGAGYAGAPAGRGADAPGAGFAGAGPQLDLFDRPASPPLDALEYLVVDLETTGGAAGRGHRITEIAALAVDASGHVREEFQTLVNPERAIPPFITRLTNITQSMVTGAPRFGDIAQEVQRLLRGRVFVAHNARFDWTFLSSELEWATGRRPLASRILCTVRLARKVLPELRRRSLDSLAWHYGIEIENRHRAYGDARATVDVLARLLRGVEEQEVYCWEGLQELLSRRKPRRRRTALPTAIEEI